MPLSTHGNSGLDVSSFYYSTPVYDLARYNNVYNSLVATYGMPISVNNTVGSIGATWFGGNKRVHHTDIRTEQHRSGHTISDNTYIRNVNQDLQPDYPTA